MAMIFTRASLHDVVLIDIERREDERGYFARTMCRAEFEAHGLISDYVQSNHSHNKRRGTLRGMHFQRAPHEEAKLVRCVSGAIYDVIIDLRSHSRTYGQWEGFALSAANGQILYVPPGFAHGYETLEEDTDVTYLVSAAYAPSHEGGIRFDDPSFGIVWPEKVAVVSVKDCTWPDFDCSSTLF